MSLLAFFPWFAVDADIHAEGYRLLRLVRGARPDNDQATLDGILDGYLDDDTTPVSGATILTKDGRDVLADLDEDDIADAFEVAECVAFAGLAKREYFQPGGYNNRETFTLVLQRFQSGASGVTIVSRRRDGNTRAYEPAGDHHVRKPSSQNAVASPSIDERLFGALLKMRAHKDCEHLAEAIYFFNKANTDSDFASEESECVEMVGAFERLLECFHGDEHEVVEKFVKVWAPVAWMDPTTCERIDPRHHSRRIADVWLRDFFRYRGFHAHGRRVVKGSAMWTRREHLLLGAYAFPLLVKQWLKERSHYELTREDEADIDVFEHLICGRHFEPRAKNKVPEYPWNSIRTSGALERALDRAVARLPADEVSVLQPNQDAPVPHGGTLASPESNEVE